MTELEHLISNTEMIIKISAQLTSMGNILNKLIDQVDKIEKDIKDERIN